MVKNIITSFWLKVKKIVQKYKTPKLSITFFLLKIKKKYKIF